MIISASLCSTPFVSSTDATRLQMASKQLGQTITHLNCKRPLTIGSNWHYLTNTTRMYRLQSSQPGTVLYSNEDMMIILYDETQELKVYDVPPYMVTSSKFATKLRYKRHVGTFQKNEIIYEYDLFNEGIPTYGYNLNSMFFPFFGVNFEDCIIISESAANELKYQKIEKLLIPVYSYSLFKSIYPNSKYGIIPEIGQKIDNNIIAVEAKPLKTTSNIKSILKSFNMQDFSKVINDSMNFITKPVITKLNDSKIQSLKIHPIGSKWDIIDKDLQLKLESLKTDYFNKLKPYAKDISKTLGPKYAEKLFKSYYLVEGAKTNYIDVPNIRDLVYLIEVELVKEDITGIGDKISNRYAGKGVIGMILPDELRPINKKTKEPIDVILGPLSIYARSNLGVVLEGLLNKTIKASEKKILQDPTSENIRNILTDLSKVSTILNNDSYSDEIIELARTIDKNPLSLKKFVSDIKKGGLFFEVPEFCTTDIYTLQKYINTKFDVNTNDTIILKKDLFKYMKNKIDISIELPTEDIEYHNIFNAPMYILKLKQLTDGKFTVRDVGEYSFASKQPIVDEFGFNKGSHIGYMEFDALIAHNNLNTIREFHNIKSDSTKEIKNNLAYQMTSTGEYEMPNREFKSYTKKIIDSLMEFLIKN